MQINFQCLHQFGSNFVLYSKQLCNFVEIAKSAKLSTHASNTALSATRSPCLSKFLKSFDCASFWLWPWRTSFDQFRTTLIYSQQVLRVFL
jgi:hypothetical protein